jgi:hypothetical protein
MKVTIQKYLELFLENLSVLKFDNIALNCTRNMPDFSILNMAKMMADNQEVNNFSQILRK